MIKIAVTGAAGRMGGRIITAVKETEGVELTGAVERAGHPLIGQDAGSVAGCGPLGSPSSTPWKERSPTRTSSSTSPFPKSPSITPKSAPGWAKSW